MMEIVMCRLLVIIALTGLFLFLPDHTLFAQTKPDQSLAKASTNDDIALHLGGQVSMWVNNNGTMSRDYPLLNAGFYYPKNTNKTVIYIDGLLWVGYVDDPDGGNPALKSGGGTYRGGLQAGPILTPGRVENNVYIPPVAADANLPEHRIYELQKNEVSDVNSEQILTGDVDNWPVQFGAPVTIDGQPQSPGERTLFFVSNDLDSTRSYFLLGSDPIGMEVQTTVFSFSVYPYHTTIFIKRKLVNKSGLTIRDMYISQWSDPDLGGAWDDLIGVDTVRNLGFCYNGNEHERADEIYGLHVPAVGYALLQGPMVDGEPIQIGISGGLSFNGKQNLNINAFVYMGSLTDNLADLYLGSYGGTIQLYHYVQGLDADGNEIPFEYGRNKGPFWVCGDPLDSTDIFLDGIKFPPDDRRMLMSSGPFDLPPWEDINGNGLAEVDEPGVQEIIIATIVGDGGDRLKSIVELRKLADAAKVFHENHFQLPVPPPAPVVTASSIQKSEFFNFDSTYVITDPLKISLEWGNEETLVNTEGYEDWPFRFQGYKVYQLPNPEASLSEGSLLFICDKIDGIGKVYDQVYDPNTSEYITRLIHNGPDNGINRQYYVTRDDLSEGPLVLNKTYFFAVTAYAVYEDDATGWGPDSVLNVGGRGTQLESEPTIISIAPVNNPPGFINQSTTRDKITPTRISGNSDVKLGIKVTDPERVTGHDYEIEFFNRSGDIRWRIINITSSDTVIPSGVASYPENTNTEEITFDGLSISVSQPTLQFLDVDEVRYFGRNIIPFDGVWHSLNNGNADFGRYFVSAGGGRGDFDRWSTYLNAAIPNDFEIRFVDAELDTVNQKWVPAHGITLGWAIYPYGSNTVKQVPFELWNIGSGTPDDPSDDVRMIPAITPNRLGRDGGLEYPWAIGTAPRDAYFGQYPESDWINWFYGDYDAFATLAETIGEDGEMTDAVMATLDTSHPDYPDSMVYAIGNFVICDFSLPVTLPYAATLPAETVIRITTTKPPTVNDRFAFTAPNPPVLDKSLARKDIDKINVFPNPFYNNGRYLPAGMTFTNLPPDNVRIRIFTISGTFVKDIRHENATTVELWNLTNESGKKVAPGMYIAYVETDFGTRILKLAVVPLDYKNFEF